MVENFSIGSCCHFGTSFQGKFSIVAIIPISSHTYIIVSGCIGYDWNVIGNFVLYQAFYSLKFQQYFSAFISNP